MRHGSLFSGIGGFDLAAQWMGWENVFHCEINPFGQKVLKHYWPNATSYSDITKTDFTIHRGSIDILTGGFPCQPYSQAGKRKGKEDERHLWPQMLRAIREIQPSWVVGENVFGIVNWDGGLVFNEVQTELEAEGYEVQPYVLPACSVQAPHRRDRVWFIAYSNRDGRNRSNSEHEINTGKGGEYAQRNLIPIYTRPTTNANHNRLERDTPQPQARRNIDGLFTATRWENYPSVAPLYSRNDGVSAGLDTDTISETKWRVESIKGYGNAIVPQVVYEIFKAIESYNLLTPTPSK